MDPKLAASIVYLERQVVAAEDAVARLRVKVERERERAIQAEQCLAEAEATLAGLDDDLTDARSLAASGDVAAYAGVATARGEV